MSSPPVYRVYVDEAGDRGFQFARGSSRFFTVGAVVVRSDREHEARHCLAELRVAFKRAPSDSLHFQKLRHSQRRHACRVLAQHPDLLRVVTATVCKKTLAATPSGNATSISSPDSLYLWALRLLLERVSWLVRDAPEDGAALVTIAHLARFKRQHLDTYVAELQASETNIAWASFGDHAFRISTPGKIDMLQVADIAVSAVTKALEPDAFGDTERQYLQRLSPIIYRHNNGPATKYGLKVFPASIASELAWLNAV